MTVTDSRPDLWQAVAEPLPGMPDMPAPGVVYLAYSHPLYWKVGWTSRAAKARGGELKLPMILTIPGTEMDEKRLHRRWGRCRINSSSEYFFPDRRMWEDIFWLAGKFGDEATYAKIRKIAREGQWKAAA